MSLHKSQTSFLNLVLPSPNKHVENTYKGSFSNKGLEIYTNNITQALFSALREIYPILESVIGPDSFKMLSLDYIQENPSTNFSLHGYGDNFSQYISNTPSFNYLKYLPDLSKLEYYIFKSLLGPNPKLFNKSAFASIDQNKFGSIIFQPIANSYLLETSYPVHKIWELNHHCSEKEINNRKIDINIENYFLFIFTIDSQIHISAINQKEFLLLQYLQKCLKFEEVCDSLMTYLSINDIVSTLSKCINLGYIDSFKL